MCLLVFVCVCVCVCVDTGTALENGEQEAHGVQKPGKTNPWIHSAICSGCLVVFLHLSWPVGLFLSFNIRSLPPCSSPHFSSALVCSLIVISELSMQVVSCSHCSATSCQSTSV